MNKLEFTTIKKAVKDSGVAYIGSVSSSAKIIKNEKFNELTYIIYLAPADLSGYNVCPMATKECRAACLHESGHNKIDKHNIINKARIKKTKLFYEHREFFMNWVNVEIKRYKKQAEKRNMKFSVRLNGTSDIDPTLFKVNGVTLFRLYPDVQFYDYTKVAKRMAYMLMYENYDVTYSYSGENWHMVKQILDSGLGKVSMVFDKSIPETYEGYKVIDGDTSDLRHYDEWGVIVGLKFKKVREKIDTYSNSFIIPLTYIDETKLANNVNGIVYSNLLNGSIKLMHQNAVCLGTMLVKKTITKLEKEEQRYNTKIIKYEKESKTYAIAAK